MLVFMKSPIKCYGEDSCAGEGWSPDDPAWGNWEDVVWQEIPENQTVDPTVSTVEDPMNTPSKDLETDVSNILICILLANI